MNHTALSLLVATCLVLLTGAQPQEVPGVCQAQCVEREEIRQPLPPMWSYENKLNCSKEGIDAATTFPTGETYFFKDDFYWRMSQFEVDPGYPRLISQDWRGLPGNLNAALTWKDGRTFFFKGHQYWSFHGKKMDKDYPRNISLGFCGIPDDIDAAILWKTNNRAYFFKGEKYWRFDGGESCVPVPSGFPQFIQQSWSNIPPNLDAAMQWKDGRSYFFKGKYFYKYNDDGKDNEAGGPIEIAHVWGAECPDLNCRLPPAVGGRTASSNPRGGQCFIAAASPAPSPP